MNFFIIHVQKVIKVKMLISNTINVHLWHSINASNKYCTLLKFCDATEVYLEIRINFLLLVHGNGAWCLLVLASGKFSLKPVLLDKFLQTSRILPVQASLVSPRKLVPLNTTACTRMLSLQKDSIWIWLALAPFTLESQYQIGYRPEQNVSLFNKL